MTATRPTTAPKLGNLNHQLCLAHVLRDLASAAELYPDDTWPVQLADELRELIHRANQARTRGETSLPERIKSIAVRGLRAAVRIGLTATTPIDDARPGARKTRLLLEAFHQREDDFLRFTTDLRIPPTSNQAERDLRPSKIQENISGRLTDLERAKDRYLIRGVLSTAAKHASTPHRAPRRLHRNHLAPTRSPHLTPRQPMTRPRSPAVTTRPNPSPSAHRLNVYAIPAQRLRLFRSGIGPRRAAAVSVAVKSSQPPRGHWIPIPATSTGELDD
ncbi:hypothetical protein E4K10_42815 [Streptomyces sp. T1317-0309]|nr:hypothetical protein E4K10_42815 [Streptomyces sp. T1317-0309]